MKHSQELKGFTTGGSNKLEYYITRLERLAIDKHSSLLGPIVSYKKVKYGEYGP